MARHSSPFRSRCEKHYTKEFDLPEDAAEQAADWEDPRQDQKLGRGHTYYMDEPRLKSSRSALEVDEDKRW